MAARPFNVVTNKTGRERWLISAHGPGWGSANKKAVGGSAHGLDYQQYSALNRAAGAIQQGELGRTRARADQGVNEGAHHHCRARACAFRRLWTVYHTARWQVNKQSSLAVRALGQTTLRQQHELQAARGNLSVQQQGEV
jgi:hypothetical protein